jgi:hypothetical protein
MPDPRCLHCRETRALFRVECLMDGRPQGFVRYYCPRCLLQAMQILKNVIDETEAFQREHAN